MVQAVDSRYETGQILSEHQGRVTRKARDRLTSTQVILKTDEQPSIARELAALLALPEQAAPAPLDYFREKDGKATLVLQHLPGETLLSARRAIGTAELPGLILDIAECLAHTHRAGIVHGDLKPSNIIILPADCTPRVRLIDFGLAIGLTAPLRAGIPVAAGGTPPYMAPEIERGWSIDERADLYSLGKIIETIFSDIAAGDAWLKIIGSLIDRSPAGRLSHATALRDALRDAFATEAGTGWRPRLCTGPLRGRERPLLQLHKKLYNTAKPARVLLQAPPGTGITRFLLESLLIHNGATEHAVRMIDLSSSSSQMKPLATRVFLKQRHRAGETLLCGLPDPSPDLCRLPAEKTAWLREMLSEEDWERFYLLPLKAEALSEMASGVLGAGGPGIDHLGSALQVISEGHLAEANEAFRELLTAAGDELCHGWQIDAAAQNLALAKIEQNPPSIPDPLRRPLQIAARAGSCVKAETLRDLLDHFAEPGATDSLERAGCIAQDDLGRCVFTSRRMREQARTAPILEEQATELWLHEHLKPDPTDADQVLEACRRARALGDADREARHLCGALLQAFEENDWLRFLRLFSYPDGLHRSWATESVQAQVQSLHRIVGPLLSAEKLTLMAAAALKTDDLSLAAGLWEELARGDDAEVAVHALMRLLEKDAATMQSDAFDRHLAAVKALKCRGAGPAPGSLELKRAWRARNRGESEEAQRLIETAIEHLQGTHTPDECLAYQQLAIILFRRDPGRAMKLMNAARGAAPNFLLSVQAHYNQAQMQVHLGHFDDCIATAEAGLRELDGRKNLRWIAKLREQRAWAWAAMDQAADARNEASSLLQYSNVRFNPARTAALLHLAGYCALHAGNASEAVSLLARAWDITAAGCPPPVRASALRYLIDALFDLAAWPLIREQSAALRLEDDLPGPFPALVRARSTAIVTQAEGNLVEAVSILESVEESAVQCGDPENLARYWHHRASATLAQARTSSDRIATERAAQYFHKALESLPKAGYRYNRGRALLGLAQARVLGEDAQGGMGALTDAIAIARDVKCRGLLADGLEMRASIVVGESVTAGD